MTSRVELDINEPQTQLARLFADPRNNPAWMDNVERIEPISGAAGQFGSVYRMVPKGRGWMFVATVVERALPEEVRLLLRGPRVTVEIKDNFVRLSDDRTRLISEETFTFEGFFRKAIGMLARGSIKRAHRRHMEAFKRFAERRAAHAL